MKRTNINLLEDQHEYVKTLAEREGKSISEIIREAVDAFREMALQLDQDDPIYSIIGMAKSDGKIGAENHDDVLYPARAE